MVQEQEPRRVPDRRVGVVIGRVRGCASTTLVCGDTQWEYHGHALCTSLLTCIWTVKGKAALRAGCYALWPPIRANRYSAPVHFLPVSRSRPIFLIMQMCAREVRAVFAHVLCESWRRAARVQDLQVIITHFQFIFHFYKPLWPDPTLVFYKKCEIKQSIVVDLLKIYYVCRNIGMYI